MELNERMDVLVAYCEVTGLFMCKHGESLMSDEGEWEGIVGAGFDPRYLAEMTPVVPIALQEDGTFTVITGEDETGDVVTEFTLEQVVQAIRSGTRLHRAQD